MVYGVVCGVWWGTVNGVVYGEVGVGVVCMWCGVVWLGTVCDGGIWWCGVVYGGVSRCGVVVQMTSLHQIERQCTREDIRHYDRSESDIIFFSTGTMAVTTGHEGRLLR